MWIHRGFITAILLVSVLPSLARATDVKHAYPKTPTGTARTISFRSLADVAEIEPNSHPAQAQAVGCGNSFRPAALVNVAAVPDTDWISFTATAGDLITLETADDGAPIETDTIVNLIADDGTTTLASNDDGPGTLYSRIADFEAPYTGLYYGRIRGFSGAQGTYRANVTCIAPPPPPENDRCEGAIAIETAGPVHLSGTTRFATDDYDLCPGMPTCATSCTGFHSPGKDVVFSFDLSAEQIDMGYAICLTYQVDPDLVDASVYIVTDCQDVQGSCVAGRDSDVGTPSEQLFHLFDAPGEYFLILDGFTAGGGDWTLDIDWNCPTPTRSLSWGSLKIIYRNR